MFYNINADVSQWPKLRLRDSHSKARN